MAFVVDKHGTKGAKGAEVNVLPTGLSAINPCREVVDYMNCGVRGKLTGEDLQVEPFVW
ncbi:MAG TPA: hypothetical protein VMV09_01855 [Candidatus Saccharimonadales bacterium]|nr:hypothetical protein [Candidatus Saccharimonadales bacterium]